MVEKIATNFNLELRVQFSLVWCDVVVKLEVTTMLTDLVTEAVM